MIVWLTIQAFEKLFNTVLDPFAAVFLYPLSFIELLIEIFFLISLITAGILKVVDSVVGSNNE